MITGGVLREREGAYGLQRAPSGQDLKVRRQPGTCRAAGPGGPRDTPGSNGVTLRGWPRGQTSGTCDAERQEEQCGAHLPEDMFTP